MLMMETMKRYKGRAAAGAATLGALAVVPFASAQQGTNQFQPLADEATSTLTSALAVALPIAGTIIAVVLGVKLFRKFAR